MTRKVLAVSAATVAAAMLGAGIQARVKDGKTQVDRVHVAALQPGGR